MYKFGSRQISFSDFGQPHGMKMSEENRWVKKAMRIPWDEIEERYAKLFNSTHGNVAKPLRLAFGACIIQGEYGYSDVETALQIQEGPYLQFFCGFKEYKDELPFDPSLMVHFRKRLTPEILGEINEMIITHNDSSGKPPKPPKNNSVKDAEVSKKPNNSDNGGTLIIDATCAPSQARYPQDTSLLNEAREKTEKMIDSLHTTGEKKARTYRRKARKEYVSFAKTKKKTAKKIRKQIKRQLSYLNRNIEHIDRQLSQGKELTERQKKQLEIIRKVYDQQKFMYDRRIHSVSDRIVSIGQPWLRPVVRGKAKEAVEFGAKLDISVSQGWTRLEELSFNAYNEAGNLQEIVERFKERTGRYPERVLADKIYRNRDNLAYCKQYGIRLSGPALGRPKKDEKKDRKQIYLDACDRIEVERRFSLAKRKCGLGLITKRLEETTFHCVAISVVLLNLRRVLLLLFSYWLFFRNIIATSSGSDRKWAYVQ